MSSQIWMSWRLCFGGHKISGKPEMPLGRCHCNSQSVEKFSPLVCIPSTRRVGRSQSRGRTHVLFRSFAELGRRQPVRAGHLLGPKQVGGHANCNVDNSDDQRGLLVRDLCNQQGLLPLSQRNWTLLWQSLEGALSMKKVDFFFTNQTTACVSIVENTHSRSDHNRSV